MTNLLKKYKYNKKITDTIYGSLNLYTNLNGEKVIVKTSYLDNITEIRLGKEYPLFEYELVSKIPKHPNIIQYYEEYEDTECHHLVMEYCPNGDLLDYIINNNLSDNEKLRIIKQIISGLQHLHSNGIVHLDISAENILLDKDYNVKIADFGLAKKLKETFNSNGFKIGKLFYMAPEIYEYEPFSGILADIYSLGILIFVLYCKHFPYKTPDKLTDRNFYLIWRKGITSILNDKNKLVIPKDIISLIDKIIINQEQRLTLKQISCYIDTLN